MDQPGGRICGPFDILHRKKRPELKDNSSQIALSLLATIENFRLVRILVKKNKALVDISGSQGMTPMSFVWILRGGKVPVRIMGLQT